MDEKPRIAGLNFLCELCNVVPFIFNGLHSRASPFFAPVKVEGKPVTWKPAEKSQLIVRYCDYSAVRAAK